MSLPNFENVEKSKIVYIMTHPYTVHNRVNMTLWFRDNLQLIHRLVGHEYGGQALLILDTVLYSGSKVYTEARPFSSSTLFSTLALRYIRRPGSSHPPHCPLLWLQGIYGGQALLILHTVLYSGSKVYTEARLFSSSTLFSTLALRYIRRPGPSHPPHCPLLWL